MFWWHYHYSRTNNFAPNKVFTAFLLCNFPALNLYVCRTMQKVLKYGFIVGLHLEYIMC